MKLIFASKNWGLSLACALALGLMLCAHPALAGTTTVLNETFDSAGDTTWPATADSVFAPATLASGSYDVANWVYACTQNNALAISGHKVARLLDDPKEEAVNFENLFSPVDMTTSNTLTISFDFLDNPPTQGAGQINVDVGPSTMTYPGYHDKGANHYEIVCDPKPNNSAFSLDVDNGTLTNVHSISRAMPLNTPLHVVATFAQSGTNTNVTLNVNDARETLQSNTIAKILPAPGILSKVNIHFAQHALGWVDNFKIQNTTSGGSKSRQLEGLSGLRRIG